MLEGMTDPERLGPGAPPEHEAPTPYGRRAFVGFEAQEVHRPINQTRSC